MMIQHSFSFFRCLIFLAALGSSLAGRAQYPQIKADVYRWAEVPVSKKASSQQRVLLEGATPAFRHLKLHATTVAAGQAPHPGHTHADEELIIVKEGRLTVTIAGHTDTLEAGSIALILPNDAHGFENRGSGPVTYYVMRYETDLPDSARGVKSGGSFVKHWNELQYKAHDKGGRRNVFDRATAQSERFEMHITTLNAGRQSHPPHTHQAAEILLLMEGEAEESIEGTWLPAGVGDIIFLQSQVPHAIRTTGQKPSTYFAFQFE